MSVETIPSAENWEFAEVRLSPAIAGDVDIFVNRSEQILIRSDLSGQFVRNCDERGCETPHVGDRC